MANNLLDKSSIILTPTAYNNGEALCVKPSDGSGDFDFSRNSAATRVNAQGLVENVQILSSNLVQNVDFSEEGAEEVSNGSFSQEGSQLIVNGDFSDGLNDWSNLDGVVTVVDGNALFTINGGLGNHRLRQNILMQQDAFYKATYTISENIGYARLRIYDGATYAYVPSTVGTHTVIQKRFGTNTSFYFNPHDGTSITIDNVSVREVGQDWEIENTWTIGDGVANGNGADGSTSELKQYSVNTIGKTYKATFEVLNYVSGTVGFWQGSGVSVIPRSADGIYTEYFTATSAEIRFRPNNFNGSITNISVKEVGMDWTLGTGVSIGSNEAVFTSTPSGQSVGQNAVAAALPNGALAKVSFEVLTRTEGTFGIYFSGTLVGTLASAGVFTGYFTKGTETSFYIRALGTTSGTISNVNVIQITDDTNLPRISYENFSYQDALGSEEVVNGGFDTDSNWNKGTGWSISGGAANANNVPNLQRLSNVGGSPSVIGNTYKYSLNVSNVSGFYSVYVYGVYVLSSANTEGTIEGYVTATSTNGAVFVAGASAGGLISATIDNVSVKEYLGQSVVPNSGCGSWLFESQSTNTLTYSEDFSEWTNISTTLTSGQLSPSGEYNATKISGTIGSSTLYIGSTSSPTATRSIYARSVSGTGTAKLMSFYQNTNNLFTLTEEWQRFELTGTTNTGGNTSFYIDFRDNTQTLNEIIVWGGQSEELTYATSYIPTSGSSVTRNQDVCINGGSLATINSTEGTLYAEIAALSNGGVGDRYISLSSGSDVVNTIQLLYHNTANRVNFRVTKNGSFQVNISDFTFEQTDNLKIAVKYKENDFALWINGLERATDTSGQTFTIGTLQKIQFNSGNGASNFFGKTKTLAVWKEALSDSELQSLTTI